jgi:hypothetical protein
VRFEFDEGGCPSRDLASAETQMDPKCWRGRLVSTHETIELEQGYMKRSGAPVAWFTWSRDGAPVAFADALSTSRVRVYAGDTPVSDETWHLVELMSLATAWWQRSASP